MALFHMGFLHAVLIDGADGRDGSSWDRERRLADRLVETTSRFDDLHEPVPADEMEPVAPEPPRGGGLIAGFVEMFGRALPAR